MGNQVRGNAMVGAALNMLVMAVPMLGAASEMGQEILSSIQRISKKMPPGASSEAGQTNALEQMRMRQMQQAPLMAALQQRAAAHPPTPTPSPPATPPAAA